MDGPQHFEYGLDSNMKDSMDTGSNGMSMDTSSPLGMQQDIKPDINQLNVATSQQGGYQPSSQPGGYPHHAPPTYTGMPPGVPFFSGMGGMNPVVSGVISPGQAPPLQSPTLSSVSQGGMGSPGGASLTPLQSPSSSLGSPPPGLMGMGGVGMTKHICAICGDRASGKHYGVYSCEGCKGFFKRTVRKDLTYACRDEKKCVIDKRQRNRCQYCRYMKCLTMGMKREAVQEDKPKNRDREEGFGTVQEERQRNKERGEGDIESTSGSANSEMPVEKVLEAEMSVEPKHDQYVDSQKDAVTNICQAADKQLFSLVDWAKRIPHFIELPLEDQVILLRAGWNELLIAGFSHRSVAVKDGILLSTGLHVHRSSAHQAGVGTIFDRVLTELVAKMREMKMDKTELGCLRAIVLFNPDAKGVQAVTEVEALREKVYASLEEYCKTNYPDEPGRFAKLLLRLPALRSIGLKCMEHLFFFKLIGDTPIDTFLMEMLENPAPS